MFGVRQHLASRRLNLSLRSISSGLHSHAYNRVCKAVLPQGNFSFSSYLHDETETFIRREPFHPVFGRQPKVCSSAEEAIGDILVSHSTVFLQGAAATPVVLANALADVAKEVRGSPRMTHQSVHIMVGIHRVQKDVKDVEVVHIHTEGPGKYAQEEFQNNIRSNSFFTGPNMREAINNGRADYSPMFLSEIPLLFRRGYKPLDVALIQTSPPDDHGFCSLGVSVDCVRAAVQCASYVVCQINRSMPRTFGDGLIHLSNFDRVVYHNEPLPELKVSEPNSRIQRIGQLIADNLVRDGATLQMGIGAIPDAVLSCLRNHTDLGIHSEMFSDGIIDLVDSGAITNKVKSMHPGKIIGGFCIGTKRLYDYIHDNPGVEMLDIQHVNDTAVIEQQHLMTAINSAIEIDVTGQIVSDSIGDRIYSGVGGQIDFIRGASRALNGVPIIALPSTTSKGESRIVPYLKAGGGVVTTRAHAHYIVTEYGIASLYGKTLRERAKQLVEIAHPDHREELAKQAYSRVHCTVDCP
eukprot:gb/GECG01002311.1/.p1 GENE.gb/GECG01002311.1/~~gb/GECG01002311.1/.p1  ORF type:complete len:523 (+),score=36.52 gb/GECG01002311.1/:1-1569(+)